MNEMIDHAPKVTILASPVGYHPQPWHTISFLAFMTTLYKQPHRQIKDTLSRFWQYFMASMCRCHCSIIVSRYKIKTNYKPS